MDFFEWLIGFSESDAIFGINNRKPYFVIQKADYTLMHKIKRMLSFGSVNTFFQNHSTYTRYTVDSPKDLKKLIALFNGHLPLNKVHSRFTEWVDNKNDFYGTYIIIKPRRNPNLTIFDNGWLSGFFDAEGCYARSFKGGSVLHLKACIAQQFEYNVMKRIAFLLKASQVRIRKAKKQHYRVEVTYKKN
eukprot:TRINITY_DN2223_c0_g1_i10.p1 TRINITY_DN2223_c0_g1~~TRINITY_DN2223_c0_g1_i10.p1  ORF type:complete len:215 (+),score=-6.74 TRINITY_DN2223_c0_g1_i10:80-646(+)